MSNQQEPKVLSTVQCNIVGYKNYTEAEFDRKEFAENYRIFHLPEYPGVNICFPKAELAKHLDEAVAQELGEV